MAMQSFTSASLLDTYVNRFPTFSINDVLTVHLGTKLMLKPSSCVPAVEIKAEYF